MKINPLRVFQVMDADRSGQIDLDEFLSGYKKILHTSTIGDARIEIVGQSQSCMVSKVQEDILGGAAGRGD